MTTTDEGLASPRRAVPAGRAADVEDRVHQAGADGLLIKLVDLNEIASEIPRVIGRPQG